jgi:hypothetical protein
MLLAPVVRVWADNPLNSESTKAKTKAGKIAAAAAVVCASRIKLIHMKSLRLNLDWNTDHCKIVSTSVS